jgi:xanthine/uracil permease
MKLKYGLEDRPGWGEMLLFGLQWLAVTVPSILIAGKVIAGFHYDDAASQIIYLQKIFFITGLLFFGQVLAGHRLPIITGPATVLLIGILASQGASIDTIYTSVFIGGLLLFLLSLSSWFKYLKKLFTPRVIVVVLLLIAFTLTPTILNMLLDTGGKASPPANLVFGLIVVLLMFVASRVLTGIYKSLIIVFAMLIGSLAYIFLFSVPGASAIAGSAPLSLFFSGFVTAPSLDIGVLAAFLICYLALSINDIASVQSVGEFLQLEDLPERVKRGISVTGLGSMISGFFGVIGPVNYSIGPGFIVSTSNASRITLLPAGLGLLLLAFSPLVIGFFGSIPSVMVGSILIYLMSSQISAGLMLAQQTHCLNSFDDALILALPVLLGVIIAFLPAEVTAAIPALLKPLLGNGFVVGLLTVLFMEHIVYTN